jgi:Protein of unknown function (DUF2946)
VYRLSAWGVIGMKWLRSNIKHSARVALFALAVQCVLSFGHFHGIATQAAPSISATQQLLAPAPSHDSDRHSDDYCAICTVIALASTGMAAAPPALPIPQAVESTPPAIYAAFLDLRSARAAFQSRAPPLS